METERLTVRPMAVTDEKAFIEGIADKALRIAYGFPAEVNETVPPEIFRHFRGLPYAYAIAEKTAGKMTGFLLDVDPELPEESAENLPEKGRTLAYAIFPPYQRRGYMTETLEAYIRYLFLHTDTAYIHCGHFSDNEPSSRLLRKLGFREYARHTVRDRIIIDEILFR